MPYTGPSKHSSIPKPLKSTYRFHKRPSAPTFSNPFSSSSSPKKSPPSTPVSPKYLPSSKSSSDRGDPIDPQKPLPPTPEEQNKFNSDVYVRLAVETMDLQNQSVQEIAAFLRDEGYEGPIEEMVRGYLGLVNRKET